MAGVEEVRIYIFKQRGIIDMMLQIDCVCVGRVRE